MATGQKTEFTIDAKDKTKRGLLSAQKNLKKTSKEANSLAKNFRSVARATVVMEGPLGGTAGRLSAVATMLGSVSLGAVALGAGFTAMTAIAYKSITAFAQWETQQLKVNQLLKQTQGASGLTADEIEEMAVRIGRATLASADDVRAASVILLSFKSIATDSFERTLDAAADLAALTGQGLKQSVIQLGKALEDPMTGLTALRRNGVSFTNAQKDMIVAMSDAGDVAGAQAEVLALLGGQMGGAGAAAGTGLAGAADAVTESWNLMLVAMARTGAGGVVETVLNNMAISLDKIGELADPSLQARRSAANIKAWNARIKLGEAIKADSEATKENTWFHKSNVAALRKVSALRDKELAAIDAEVDAKDAATAAARRRGAEAQKEIQKTKELAAAQKLAAAAKKTAEAELKKETKSADTFGQKLIDEEQKFQTSLLIKSQQEDVFYAEKLMKLQEFHAAGAMSEEAANAAGLAARQLHEAKLTEIALTEKEKQEEDDAKLKELQVAATQTALGDIGTLMAASSKKLFKLGQAAAIANSLVNTYQAVTKTMASVPYPFNIPLAVAQGLAGMVQVQKIKNQKMAAKEFGGSVIGGRSYLVGERGPELFTPPRTGQIINNNATSNVGGQSNVFNITNVLENDEAFIRRNTVKIWDSIIDRMNEEGLRFAQ